MDITKVKTAIHEARNQITALTKQVIDSVSEAAKQGKLTKDDLRRANGTGALGKASTLLDKAEQALDKAVKAAAPKPKKEKKAKDAKDAKGDKKK